MSVAVKKEKGLRVKQTAKAVKKQAAKPSKRVKAAGSAAGARKFKWRPGTVALRQIRKLQKGTNSLIARAPFARLLKAAAADSAAATRFRWERSAVAAAHEATEAWMVAVLADANLCALHARRVTVMPRDVHLARRLRGDRL